VNDTSLVSITVDVKNHKGSQDFFETFGLFGYGSDWRTYSAPGSYKVTLEFLNPISVPTLQLVDLLNECISSQENWRKEE